MVGVMVRQVHCLCTVAHQHMPTLVSNSHLPKACLAIAEDSAVAARASVQVFIELCRSALAKLEYKLNCAQGTVTHAPHIFISSQPASSRVHRAAFQTGKRQAVVCRQHLSQLLEGLALLTQQAASASAPHCAASLLHLTQALVDQHASLCSQTVPPDFADLLAEAVRKSVSLCVSCVRHQVQAITLRLATSDLFDVQAGSASGTQSPCSFLHISGL